MRMTGKIITMKTNKIAKTFHFLDFLFRLQTCSDNSGSSVLLLDDLRSRLLIAFWNVSIDLSSSRCASKKCLFLSSLHGVSSSSRLRSGSTSRSGKKNLFQIKTPTRWYLDEA